MLRSSLCLLAFFLFFTVTQSTCFYPDGSPAVDFKYTACNDTSTTGYSACCIAAEGDQCLPGGLCYWPAQLGGHGNYIYRGACTDKSWTDPSCATGPAVCADYPNHFEQLSFCQNTTDYCCPKSTTGECCEQERVRFKMEVSVDIMIMLQQGSNATVSLTSGGGPTYSSPAGVSSSTALPHESSALSSGAKAGIIVAALVGCGLVFGVGCFFGRRRYRASPVRSFVRRLSKQPSKDDIESAQEREANAENTQGHEEKAGLIVVESAMEPAGKPQEPTVEDEASEPHHCHELPEDRDPVQMP